MSIITLNTRSLPDSAVTTAKIAADAVTDAKIADDVIGTEHLTAGEVDTTALGADAVTAAKIADDAISEEHLDATAITGMTELAAEPADTDEFLISDAGTLKRIDYSHIKGVSDFVKIASTTLSSATSSVSLTGMDSTYKSYKIIGSDITLASSDNYFFRFINSSGDLTGSSYFGVIDGAYRPYNSEAVFNKSANINSSYGRVQNFDPSTNATNGSSFEMIIPNPSNSTTYPYCFGSVGWSGSNGTYMVTGTFAFQYTSAGAITGVKFYGNGSVNTSTGTFALYGIKG